MPIDYIASCKHTSNFKWVYLATLNFYPKIPHKGASPRNFLGTESILKIFSKLEKDVDIMKLFRVQQFSYFFSDHAEARFSLRM